MILFSLIVLCLTLVVIAATALRGWRRAERELEQALEASQEAEAQSRHCRITGLANYQSTCEWLREALDDKTLRPAIVRVGIVPFAPGPEREIALARTVAGALAACAPGKCLVARIDPGQYLVALDGSAGCAWLVSMARSVCATLGRLLSDSQRLRVGVALAVGGDTPAALIERAEETLHRCADKRPVSLAFSDDDMSEEIEQRTLAAAELARAIAANRIEPFYQPFVELDTGRVLGFEALARWRDEEGRMRMPAEFLPLAEESGLVGPMFYALLAATAVEAATWPAEWNLALNLSAHQFGDPDLVEKSIGILHDAGIAPARLELEISERALEGDIAAARALVAELRTRGIRVTLDNFGSGNLHLRELASIAFDRIKVNPAAIRRRTDVKTGTALGLIAAAADHLGVPVLVQGIETHAGAAEARIQGCTVGQGYLFGRPLQHTDCFRLDGSLARKHHEAA